jgi:hypothetical protein
MNQLVCVCWVTRLVVSLSVSVLISLFFNILDDYEAFNMPMLMREAEKLKLPNQQLTVTVHTLAGDHESSLYFAVNACRRYNIHHNPLERERQHRVLLSGECLWRHLQHVDEDSISNQEKEARARYPLSNKQHVVGVAFISCCCVPISFTESLPLVI